MQLRASTYRSVTLARFGYVKSTFGCKHQAAGPRHRHRLTSTLFVRELVVYW